MAPSEAGGPAAAILALARAHGRAGCWVAAAETLALAASMAADPGLWAETAAAHLRAGDRARADDAFGRALALAPDYAPGWVARAAIALDRGGSAQALSAANRALAVEVSAAALLLRATAQGEGGARDLARALALAPGDDAILTRLGLGLARADPDAALAWFDRLVAMGAAGPAARCNRGNLRAGRGRAAEALEDFQAALAADPTLAEAHLGIGLARLSIGAAAGDPGRPLAIALALAPANRSALLALASALGPRDRGEAAIRAARRGQALDLAAADGWNALGLALRLTGEAEASFHAFARAVALAPEVDLLHSNAILASLYLDDDPDRERALLSGFAARFPRPDPCPIPDPDPARPLRVGYVSADFRRHPVGFFLAPVLEAHDRAAVTPILYANMTGRDPWTDRLRASAAAMIGVAGMSDAALAARLRADGIDVLVDLSGHTAGNRLGLLALQAAPVQFTWGGLVGSSGLSLLDGLIGDPVEIPARLDGRYAEPVLRLIPDYVCYAPPDDAPPVAPPPAGPGVTFGCFNNILKVNDRVLDLWAAILGAAPATRLLLKGPGFTGPTFRARLARALANHGVAPERARVEGPSNHAGLLAAYGAVDLALDPFPYGGGLTTLEALWMGVPVLTLTGARFTERHSASHLSALGLETFITADRAAYQARALALAADPAALRALRPGLRERMAASPLCDGRHVAAQVEAFYRDAWRRRIAAAPDPRAR